MLKKTAGVSEAKSKASVPKGKAKKIRSLIVPAVFIVIGVQYTKLDESKKRFIKHLAKQIPYLPGRYYA